MKIYKLVTGIRLSYTTNRPGRLPVIAMIDKNRTIVDLVIKKFTLQQATSMVVVKTLILIFCHCGVVFKLMKNCARLTQQNTFMLMFVPNFVKSVDRDSWYILLLKFFREKMNFYKNSYIKWSFRCQLVLPKTQWNIQIHNLVFQSLAWAKRNPVKHKRWTLTIFETVCNLMHYHILVVTFTTFITLAAVIR